MQGVGSDTTRDILRRCGHVNARRPYDLVVLLGCNYLPRVNDANPQDRTDIEEYGRNQAQLLPAIRGERSIFITFFPVDPARTGVSVETFERYVERARSISLESGYEVVDLYAIIEESCREYLATDGIHFNPHGHRVIADLVKAAWAVRPFAAALVRRLLSQKGGKGQSEESIFESVRFRSAVQDDAATEARPQRRPAFTQPLQVARVHAVSGLDLHTHHHALQFDQDIHLAAVVGAPEEKRGAARLAAPCPQVVHHPRLDHGAALLRRLDRLAIPQSRQCRRHASVAPVEFRCFDKSFAEIGAVWRQFVALVRRSQPLNVPPHRRLG